MWFKQISLFILKKDTLPEIAHLTEKLTHAAFTPIVGLDWFSEGFVAPYHFADELAYSADFTWSLALKKSEKVLPAAVIRDFLDEKIAQIQETENRQVGRKEKQELKEQITDDLLLRAFTRSSRTYAICDTRTGFLFINGTSNHKAEILLTKLREALGSLEARLPNTQRSPSSLMTEWLSCGHAEGGFELDCDVELRGQGDVAPVVKITKSDLTSNEVIQHLQTGKTVSQMSLIWREQIAFTLTDDFKLKKIQYLDVLQEQAESHGDDAATLAFASQIIMTETLSNMINELVTYLGGWQE